MPDAAVTAAVLADELGSLRRWAARAGWHIDYDPAKFVLRVEMKQLNSGEHYILRGDCADYKSVPPAWTFIEPDTGLPGTFRAFPAPPALTPSGGPHVFLNFQNAPRICLPSNRLAYGFLGGPHNDWNIAEWMNVQPSYVTLTEMIDRIHTELQASAGRWSPL